MLAPIFGSWDVRVCEAQKGVLRIIFEREVNFFVERFVNTLKNKHTVIFADDT